MTTFAAALSQLTEAEHGAHWPYYAQQVKLLYQDWAETPGTDPDVGPAIAELAAALDAQDARRTYVAVRTALQHVDPEDAPQVHELFAAIEGLAARELMDRRGGEMRRSNLRRTALEILASFEDGERLADLYQRWDPYLTRKSFKAAVQWLVDQRYLRLERGGRYLIARKTPRALRRRS